MRYVWWLFVAVLTLLSVLSQLNVPTRRAPPPVAFPRLRQDKGERTSSARKADSPGEASQAESKDFPDGISFDEGRFEKWRSDFRTSTNRTVDAFCKLLGDATPSQSKADAERLLQTQEYASCSIAQPFDWSCRQIANRSVRYRLHGLLFLDGPFLAWWRGGRDNRYRDYILAWMKSWLQAHPRVDTHVAGMAFHDDATARRVCRMSLYLYLWGDALEEDVRAQCKVSLREHAALLATDGFYTHGHNHGMYQDIALLAYAALHEDDIRQSAAYVKLACSRTLSYLNAIISPEGVHKEHSPGYHVRIHSDMQFFSDVCRELDGGLSSCLIENASRAARYAASLVQPDGTLPSVGDSARGPLRCPLWEGNAYYDAVVHRRGLENLPLDFLYPKSGYAIFRNSWTNAPCETTYFMFSAAFHNKKHKHGDDLGFILYHRGDLFVEAGHRNYLYKEPLTRYAYSGFAHNVLIVDGKDFPVTVGSNGWRGACEAEIDTRVLDAVSTTNYCRAVGIQGRFEGVVQRRCVEYWKNEGLARISDETVAAKSSKLEYLYHVAPGVQVEEIDGGWNLLRDGRLVATAVAGGEVESVETIRDKAKFPYCTYVFDGKPDARLGTLLKINAIARKGRKKRTCLTVVLR